MPILFRFRYLTRLFFVGLVILSVMACQPATPPPSPAPHQPANKPTGQPTNTPAPQPTRKPTAQPTPQPTSPPTPPSKPATGGTLRLGLGGLPPDTLNPVAGNAAVLAQLQPLLYESLLTADPQTAELRPRLAESWEYSTDGQQVTFQIPPDLRWSNGAPLDAAAIAASLTATRHPALRAFSTLEAVDSRTLRLTFNDIDCAALSTVALLPLLPSEEMTATIPAGSGPFLLQTWSADRRALTLTPNPHYHGSPPRLDALTLRFLADTELEIALSEGQFDMIGPIPAGQKLHQTGQFVDVKYSAAKMIVVMINFAAKNGDTLPPALHTILPLALDREHILTEALNGDGQLLAGPLLPQHWAADNTLTPPPYNPAEARQMLAQAGLRDTDGDGWLDDAGQRLEIGIRVNGQNPLHQNLAWLISDYYRDLGLFARAETVPVESLLDDLFTHDFQAAVFGWPVLPEPDQRQFWHSAENTVGAGLNFMSYQNNEVDKLLDAGNSVPGCGLTERAKIYQAFQAELDKTPPVDFLVVPNLHLLIREYVDGLAPGPFAPFTWNISQWYLREE